MSAVLEVMFTGLIVGIVARLIVPGRNPIGFLGTLAVGVAGALLGWWAGRDLVSPRSVNQHPWLWAIAGAIVVLLVVRALSHRRGFFRSRWLSGSRWRW